MLYDCTLMEKKKKIKKLKKYYKLSKMFDGVLNTPLNYILINTIS